MSGTTASGKAKSGTTPFPNFLLDEAMPRLKDTEWRVLCVIVRQTLGWQSKDGTQRKTSDWMTQAQLVRKTGRDRAALSRAIDTLVKHKWIDVRNERGDLLRSPQERRQCKSRLFYGLHPRLLENPLAESSRTKSEHQTSDSNSLLNNQPAKSEFHRAPKANTTKETLTKEIVTKGFKHNSLKHLTAEVFHGTTSIADQVSIQEKLPEVQPEYSIAAQNFITLFERYHRQEKGDKANTCLTIDQAARLERLIASRPSFDWTPILQDFLTSDSGFIVRRNHSLPAFLDSCHIFLLAMQPHPAEKATRQ